MRAFFFAKNRNTQRRNEKKESGDQHEWSKHRMQKRRDAAAEIKISQDPSPFEKREWSQNAAKNFHRRKGASDRQSSAIKTNKPSAKVKVKRFLKDEPVHEQQLHVHHRPEDHEREFRGDRKSQEICGNESVRRAAQRKQPRQDHHAGRGQQMIARQRKQNFLVDRSVEHARDGRADDQIKSNVEKIERGTTDRADNFLSEALFVMRFIVQMHNLFGGNDRENEISFAGTPA